MNRTDLFWATIKPGDVINLWPRKLPPWWTPLGIVERQIQHYQKRKWGKNREYRPTHSQLYLGNGETFEVTVPIARFAQLRLSDKTCYTIHRYTYKDFTFQQSDIDLMRIAASQLVGKEYDYLQLIDILLKQLFPVFLPQTVSIFDLGRKRKVCSVGVHYCLLYWWKNVGRPENMRTPIEVSELPKEFPRPLEKQYVEITCPADFSNHQTFKKVF